MSKEIAMKPYDFIDVFNVEDVTYNGIGCPNCKFTLWCDLFDDYPDLRGIRYCVKCGQKLDWSCMHVAGSILYRIIEDSEGDEKHE